MVVNSRSEHRRSSDGFIMRNVGFVSEEVEVSVRNGTIKRRSFLGAMAGLPAGVLAQRQTADPSGAGVKVAAGEGRFGRTLKLPDGRPLLIKVATQDTGGALFLTEQSSVLKGGPPKHFHLEEDEWFYCLAGEYIVEVGTERYELKPGDSVLGPRRVPHAFAFVGNTPGRLLVGFTPAGRLEQFFRDLDARGRYFGTGTDEDRETARRRYGIVNVGPPLAF
jgi:mannose-6-phosphate isomerase-like protein (cupin superfamily)